MSVFLRTIAIIIEVGILASIISTIIYGVKLAAFDLGLGSRYQRMIMAVMIMIGSLIVVFFIAHLTSFYPAIGG